MQNQLVTLNIKSCSKDYLSRVFRTSDKRVLPALQASISRLLWRGTASFLPDAYTECATHRALICAEYKIHLTHSHAFRHVVVGGGIAVRKVPTVFLITFPASALYEPVRSSERIATTSAFFLSIRRRPMKDGAYHLWQKLGFDDDRNILHLRVYDRTAVSGSHFTRRNFVPRD